LLIRPFARLNSPANDPVVDTANADSSSTANLIQQIRFGIQCLNERNGHHEFEEACRHFARLRITLNILPATGPVGAGGDQGRDFETFRTFIHGLGAYKFAGVGGGKRLAFACSLAAERRLATKIKEDVCSIMAGVLKPSVVYFFAGVSLPISQRHELQSWAKGAHDIELEIIDAVALSEQLSARDVFWIAVRYFNISPEVYPQTDTEESYNAVKKEWLEQRPASENFADFIEVKQAARQALDDCPEDLPRWIQKLIEFESRFGDSPLWVRVTYEIIALTMRLTRSLQGQEERIRRFMGRNIATLLPDEIEDALTIASYAWTARELAASSLHEAEVRSWLLSIGQRIDDGITSPASKNQKCLWLKEAGRIRFHLAVVRGELPNPADVYKPWLELSTEVADSSTFPVQGFHEDVLDTIEIVGEHVIFDEILNNLRPVIHERVGDAAVAESHFERARQLVETHQIARALQELHKAKIQWFSEKTVGQSVFCCLVLANGYADLGLHYASIYYALTASFIAANSNADWLVQRAAEGVFRAADSAYCQGHICLAWELWGPALVLHHKVAPDPRNLDKHGSFKRFFHNLSLVLTTTEKLSPKHYQRMLTDLEHWGLRDVAESFVEDAKPLIANWDEVQFKHALESTFTGPPFSDAGERCVCIWSAHGLRFSASWKNDYDVHRYAGEFVALFQIALADLEGMDLDIVPGTVLLDVETSDESNWDAEQLPSNETHHWRVQLPKTQKTGNESLGKTVPSMLAVFYKILRGLSVMPADDFERRFRADWVPRTLGHAFFARRYCEEIEFFFPRGRYEAIGRDPAEHALSSEEWMPKEPEELKWFAGVHPRFDEADELVRIQKRYDVCFAGLRLTLPRLRESKEFVQMVEKFHAEGWKDWHILAGILNVVAGIRVDRRQDVRPPSPEWAKAVTDEIFTAETETSAKITANDIKPDAVYFTMLATMQSTMAGNGLTPSSRTPNLEGEKRYMAARWRYFELDVPHPALVK
jgi:hypothetical protein